MGLEDEIRSRKAQHADDSERRAAEQRIVRSGFTSQVVSIHTPTGDWAGFVSEAMPILRRSGSWITRMLYDEIADGGRSVLAWRGSTMGLMRLKPFPAGGRSVRGTLVGIGKGPGGWGTSYMLLLDSGLIVSTSFNQPDGPVDQARRWVVDLGAGVAKSPPADQKL